MKIFLSYTTRDSIITPERLQGILPALSHFGGVFIDALHNDSIDKQHRVKKELEAADIVILLKSRSISKSKWVTWEINRAAALGIPIHSISVTSDQELLPQVVQQLPRSSSLLSRTTIKTTAPRSFNQPNETGHH